MNEDVQNWSHHKTMLDASETAKHYMFKATGIIDKRFGKNYAEKHPELIGAFMQTAAIDFATGMMVKHLISITDHLSDITNQLSGMDV